MASKVHLLIYSLLCIYRFSMNVTRVTPNLRSVNSTFNQDPGMETYQLIILVVCYSIVCLAILTVNYLMVRAFITNQSLLYHQRYFLGYLACADLVVGLASIPTFLYNMTNWPSYSFYIYEASDCASGFGSASILVALSVQALRSTFRSPTRYAGYPKKRNFYLVIAGSTFIAGGAVAFNVACLMDYVSFFVYFYLAVGLLAITALFLIFTCTVVMVSQLYGKVRETDRDEDKKIVKSVIASCAVYVVLWALPYTGFTYYKFCNFCVPVSIMFLYSVRIVLYLKSILMLGFYFYTISSLHRTVKKILTYDCLGIPRYRYTRKN